MRAGSGACGKLKSRGLPIPARRVTFTMMPQRAYVLLPRQIVSTVARFPEVFDGGGQRNELGGTMHTSLRTSTNELGSNAFGSRSSQLILVKILNSGAQRMS